MWECSLVIGCSSETKTLVGQSQQRTAHARVNAVRNVFKSTMSNSRHSNMSSSYDNCGSDERMDVEIDVGHAGGTRGNMELATRAACSSNGSGGEEDETEAADQEREAAGSSTPRSVDGVGHACGREQEVSVEIGETYLCQRADKSWRKLIRDMANNVISGKQFVLCGFITV